MFLVLEKVVAVFSALFILNKSIEECLKISNKCAGLVISKNTVPIKKMNLKIFKIVIMIGAILRKIGILS